MSKANLKILLSYRTSMREDMQGIRYPPGQSTMVTASLHLRTASWEILALALARPV